MFYGPACLTFDVSDRWQILVNQNTTSISRLVSFITIQTLPKLYLFQALKKKEEKWKKVPL